MQCGFMHWGKQLGYMYTSASISSQFSCIQSSFLEFYNKIILVKVEVCQEDDKFNIQLSFTIYKNISIYVYKNSKLVRIIENFEK